MSLTKKTIVKELQSKTNIRVIDSKAFLEKFIEIIKRESFTNDKSVKISGYGTFTTKKTAKRIGRNPKTKDSYIICERKKLTFSTSSKIKGLMN